MPINLELPTIEIQHLKEAIDVIRAGLEVKKPSIRLQKILERWCEEGEYYLDQFDPESGLRK